MGAGNAIIGALRAVLGIETAQFETGLKSAQSQLSGFGAGVAKAGAAAAVAFAAAGAAVAIGLKGAIESADKLNKASQSIGMPVEELSKLKYAADLSDVSMESLGVSMGKLSKSMSAVAGGAAGPAAEAFKALRIEVQNSDGSLKSNSVVLGEIAGKFKGYEDGAAKTALAIAIFGKAGAAMIPLLNQGKDGLAEASAEAERYGLVLDKRTAMAAEAFNDNLKRMSAITEGAWTQLAAKLLPTLEGLSKILLTNKENSSLLSTAMDGLAYVLKTAAAAGVLVYNSFSVMGTLVGSVASAVLLVAKGQFTAAYETLQKGAAAAAASTAGNLKIATQAYYGFAGNAKLSLDGVREAIYGKIQAPIIEAAEKTKDAFTSFIDTTKKSTAAHLAEAATVGLAAGAKERLTVVMKGLEVAQAASITMTDAMRQQLSTTAFAAEQAALKLAGMQLIQQNLTPMQAYTAELYNTNTAMVAAGASQEMLIANADRVAEKFGMSAAAIGTSIAGTMGSLSQLTGTFAKENSTMGALSKAFGIGQAIINTQIAITKALATLPPPASYAAVAFAVAQGAAAVAQISAQKFATGGAMRVPGGMGGGDKVRTMVDLEPGEQLDIWRPDQGGSDPRRGGGSATPVLVRAPDVTRDFIGALIKGINGAVKDGYRLELAPA